MVPIEQIHEEILEKLDLDHEATDEELLDLISFSLQERSKVEFIPLQEKIKVTRKLFNSFRKLDILQELLEDEEITEIMVNGTKNIFIEKAGRVFLSESRFSSRKKLEDIVQQIVSGCNRVVNESVPIADARLDNGARVNIVLEPVALEGPVVTIRKFPKNRITLSDLLKSETLNTETAEFLIRTVRAGYNIFISGGTGSGKTTLLNVLSDFIPVDERVITIEDNAELQITGLPNLVRLEARNPNIEGVGEITIRSLIKTALRMRPDRIIVGEVRGPEVIDMLQANNTGHNGSLSTGHGNSAKDMLSRLETMFLMGMDIPLTSVQKQIASGIDIMVHLGRLRDKSRKILEIVEVLGYENGEITLQTLFRFRETGTRDGRIQGEWVKYKALVRREKLLAAGDG